MHVLTFRKVLALGVPEGRADRKSSLSHATYQQNDENLMTSLIPDADKPLYTIHAFLILLSTSSLSLNQTRPAEANFSQVFSIRESFSPAPLHHQMMNRQTQRQAYV